MYQLSIIIPTYNYAQFLPALCAGIFPQLSPALELIIIDDGSTDNTVAYLATKTQQAHFHYYRQKNAGPGAARNAGAQRAKGEYLLFLDADDCLTEGALDIYLEKIASNPKVDFFLGASQSRTEQGQIRRAALRPLSPSKQKNFIAYLLTKKLSIVAGSFIVKKSVFFEIGGYSTALKNREDLRFFAYLCAKYQGESISHYLVTVYKHQDSLRHQDNCDEEEIYSLVNTIFNEDLPVSLRPYKRQFYAKCYLSIFRTAYLQHHYSEARRFYHIALRAYSPMALRFAYLKKYIKLFF